LDRTPPHPVARRAAAPLNVVAALAVLFAAALATGSTTGLWLVMAAASAFALSGSA
jgi:hypothetical protein